MTKPEVFEALRRLKAFLEARSGRINIVYLPSGEGGAKVGLDDFLAAGNSVDDLLALASEELRQPPRPESTDALYEATKGGVLLNQLDLFGERPPPCCCLGTVGQMAIGRVNHLQARSHKAAQFEDRDPGGKCLRRKGVPQIVNAALW